MKERITTKFVEQTTHEWIAEDGMIFTDEKSCKIHENELNDKELKRKFNKLLVSDKLYFPFMDWNNGEMSIEVLYLRNSDDWDTMYAYYHKEVDDFSVTYSDEPKSYPAIVVMAGDYYYKAMSRWDIQDMIKETQNSMEQLQSMAAEVENKN